MVLKEILYWSLDRPAWQRDALRRLVESRSPSELPDLLSAFRRATRRGDETERETRDTEQRVHGEELRPSIPPDNDGPQKPRDRG